MLYVIKAFEYILFSQTLKTISIKSESYLDS